MNKMLNLQEDFTDIFKRNDMTRVFFAPGRVNLIGEHTDYNGGLVFPLALSLGTYCAAVKREDKTIRVYSKNFEDSGIIEFSIEDLFFNNAHGWANYPKGILNIFLEYGYKIDSGFDALFYGNLPNGAGLSSSASIELVTSVMLSGLFNLNIDMISMVKMSQEAENNFIGVKCGIMDQFASGMGQEGMALLLNCKTLDCKYAPINLKDSSIIIANTNKRRSLKDSKYNERLWECQGALRDLRKRFDIEDLCQMSVEDFEENQGIIKDTTMRKRAKHVIYENTRTLQAYKALEKSDIMQLGLLLNRSHTSLRDDFEVTGTELDTLVELALMQEGVIGSRMTGAGFGGCTLSIVKNNAINSFIDNVGEEYEKRIGYKASFYIAGIGNGAREVYINEIQ